MLVPTRADLARALRRLVGAGARLEGASDHLVSEALYLSDPEGNGIELYRDRPREQWPRTGESIQMATIPLDLDDLLTENGADAAAMPAGTTLGHVHLQVSDLESAEPFWVDALGFEVDGADAAPRGVRRGGRLSPPRGSQHLGRDRRAAAAGWSAWSRPVRGAAERRRARRGRRRLARVSEVERTGEGALARDPSGNAVLLRT